MPKRLRRYLNPPMVIATIALFVALGGGYAAAFSGSGTLQKANVTGLSNDENEYTTVRTLTGIGTIIARCPNTGLTEITFTNTSGKVLVMESTFSHEGEASVPSSGGINPNETTGFTMPSSTNDWLLHWYIQPALGVPAGSKSPQANIHISVFTDTNCGGSRVAVLALNTQQ